MTHEGPPLEPLLRHLAETPTDFLAEPRIGDKGVVRVAAVIGDLFRLHQHVPAPTTLALGEAASDSRAERNRLSVILLLSSLLRHPSLHSRLASYAALTTLLKETAAELAAQVTSSKFVSDPDRREELARLTLARLDLRPQGETLAQAQDRLTSLSSSERARVMKAAKAAELRAREIRAALARKAAEESADKWTRE